MEKKEVRVTMTSEEKMSYSFRKYQYIPLDDGTVEITGYYGKTEDLVIPSMMHGMKVSKIGNSVFSSCDFLTSITIPNSVVSIGDSAFEQCHSLSSVTLPASLISLGAYTFSSCYSLSSITVPDSVAFIGANPFVGCHNHIFVSLDNPFFAVIGNVLFRKSDKALISYIGEGIDTPYAIPHGITIIEDSAFSWASVNFVSIPDSVTKIVGSNPFLRCLWLKAISVSTNQLHFRVIDGVLFHTATWTLLSYPCNKRDANYTIPNATTFIGKDAFAGCDFLQTIRISSSVTIIDCNAFNACHNLHSVFISESVSNISNGAFSSCSSLSIVTIPSTVVSIGKQAFFSCNSLENLTLPDSITYIGENAFAYCPNLTLTVPRNSYAAEYAQANNIPYTYPDANDWLYN